MDRRKRTRGESPSLSATSILIFSGFLIGLALAQPMGRELATCVMMCGLSGLLAFVVLDKAAERRGDLRVQRVRKQMEQRLRKHIRSCPTVTPDELLNCLNEIEAELMKI